MFDLTVEGIEYGDFKADTADSKIEDSCDV